MCRVPSYLVRLKLEKIYLEKFSYESDGIYAAKIGIVGRETGNTLHEYAVLWKLELLLVNGLRKIRVFLCY